MPGWASSPPRHGSRAGVNCFAIEHNNAFASPAQSLRKLRFVCGGREVLLCLAPRPVCVTHGFAQRAQAAILVGTRFASAQRLICASRAVSRFTSPRPPPSASHSRGSSPCRASRSRSVGRALPSAPRGSPMHARFARGGAHKTKNSARLAVRTAQHAKVWHAVQGQLSLTCTAATSVFSLERCQGQALRVRAVARSLDTRRHRCSFTKKPSG